MNTYVLIPNRDALRIFQANPIELWATPAHYHPGFNFTFQITETREMVEEAAMMEESAAIAKRPSSARSENNRDELEEGEVEPADLSSSELEAAAPPALMQSTHPLGHSRTFWFDNPSAKSKQAAWGSSILPVHTFATVDDFWR